MSSLANKIAANLRYQKHLFWKIGEIAPGCTTIGETFVNMVMTMQRDLGLVQDGIVGPITLRWVLARRTTRLLEEIRHTDGDRKLETAGQLALAQARLTWAKDVIDTNAKPASIELIDSMIRSPVGINWSWRAAYTANTFQWCGAAAAAFWRDTIPLADRHAFWSSTYRLDAWFRYEDLHLADKVHRNIKPTPDMVRPLRHIMNLDATTTAAQLATFAGTGPRAGDILIVGTAGEGQHICVVDHFDPKTSMFTTYEGNGVGAGPAGGKDRDGVSRGQRRLGRPAHRDEMIARRLARPGSHDIVCRP